MRLAIHLSTVVCVICVRIARPEPPFRSRGHFGRGQPDRDQRHDDGQDGRDGRDPCQEPSARSRGLLGCDPLAGRLPGLRTLPPPG